VTVPASTTRAQTFNLTTPYLQQGITSDERARSDLLTVLIKVYASGGENRMHAHVYEDHENNCPHRGASLFFGRNEEAGIRCVCGSESARGSSEDSSAGIQ
jgi:hypothetical protein